MEKGMPEMRLTIPPEMMKYFAQEPRLVLKPLPGIWPIDPGWLAKINWRELAANEEFNKSFEVVVVPRAQ